MKDLRKTQEKTNALLEAFLHVVPLLSLQNSPPFTQRTPSTNAERLPQRAGTTKRIEPRFTTLNDSYKDASLHHVAIPVSTVLTNERGC